MPESNYTKRDQIENRLRTGMVMALEEIDHLTQERDENLRALGSVKVRLRQVEEEKTDLAAEVAELRTALRAIVAVADDDEANDALDDYGKAHAIAVAALGEVYLAEEGE